MSDPLFTIGVFLSKWFVDLLTGWGVPAEWAKVITELFAWGIGCAWGLIVIMMAALVFIYLERKVAGYIQSRLGPARCGPAGVFQSFTDALKLLLKEDIVPAEADRLLHWLGPVVFLVASALAFVVIPWDRGRTTAGLMDANIGLLFAAAVSSLAMAGIIIGGWGSNNKWSLLGAIRGAAQMVSYEVPLLLALLCIVMQAQTLSMAGIVENQHGGFGHWNIARPWLWLPMLIFVISSIAEINRTPFDLPEAESELVSGYHTEYTGMKFALYFLGEYGNVYLVSSIFTVLFLGGWQSPFGNPDPLGALALPGLLWLLGKALGFVLFLMWVRWTLPRLRVDQLMAMSWKLLIPAGFIALAIMMGVILAGIA
jgi:NADH-quinone oxidoreductase subunit H